jgi:hypothetical protein
MTTKQFRDEYETVEPALLLVDLVDLLGLPAQALADLREAMEPAS